MVSSGQYLTNKINSLMKKTNKVKVYFYTILKEKTGVDEIEVNADTVHKVVQELKKVLGKNFVNTLCEPSGKVKDYFIFLLNGKTVDHNKFKTTKLKSGDELHIFPPIAGG